jgi:hypothetical protein
VSNSAPQKKQTAAVVVHSNVSVVVDSNASVDSFPESVALEIRLTSIVSFSESVASEIMLT